MSPLRLKECILKLPDSQLTRKTMYIASSLILAVLLKKQAKVHCNSNGGTLQKVNDAITSGQRFINKKKSCLSKI